MPEKDFQMRPVFQLGQIEMGILVDKMKSGDSSTSTTEILKWKNCSVSFLEYVTISNS